MKINYFFKLFLFSTIFISTLFANNTIGLEKSSKYIISSVEDDTIGYIDVPNLKVGQSGIILNNDAAPFIVAVASVVSSNDKNSKVVFTKYEDLKQDAIPTSKLKVKKGDTLILKYLYDASMLIAPNIDSFQVVRKELKGFSFLHPDLFAAFLKVEEEPVPTKELIQQFAIEQNLGSLVIVLEAKAYLIDTRTFKIVDSIDIKYENDKNMAPFYTRVDEIEQGTFDFGEDSIGKYTKYYKKLLDI